MQKKTEIELDAEHGSLRLSRQRLRIPAALPLPRLPGENAIPWAARNKEIRRSPLDDVLRVVTSNQWRAIVLPTARRIDGLRREGYASGQKSVFRLDQMLAITLLRTARADETYQDTLEWLSCDQATPLRIALDLNAPHEDRADRRQYRRDGVPGQSSVYHYLRNFLPAGLRLDLLGRLNLAYLHELVVHPYFRPGCRLLMMDGCKVQIYRTPPILDPDTGEIVNADRVTAWDASYIAKGSGLSKTGHGYTIGALATVDWLILGTGIGRITIDEQELCNSSLDHYQRHFWGPLGDEIAVLSADANFARRALRERCRRLGIVDNFNKLIRGTGDVDDEDTADESDDGDTDATGNGKITAGAWPLPLDDRKGWYVDRTHQIVCECRMAARAKLVDRTAKGAVTTGVGVSCRNCGRFQVTSGTYRYARNPPKYVRTGPGERGDLTVGHFLTRTDRYAKMLSRTRFGLGEGLFGSFAQRYEILLGGRHKITSLQDLNLRLAAILVLHHAAAHDWATNQYCA